MPKIVRVGDFKDYTLVETILVYTFLSRIFDLMQFPVVKHSIAVA